MLRFLEIHDDEPMNSLVQANENARATSDILAVSVEGPVGGVIKLIRTTEKAKKLCEVEVRATHI
jgi:hypothetical protein